jgi:hypothetical protein
LCLWIHGRLMLTRWGSLPLAVAST